MPDLSDLSADTRGKPTDIHVVSRNMSDALVQDLLGLGFQSKIVAGGDPRVRMDHLYSIVHDDVEMSDAVYAKTIDLCSGDDSFFGYVEQEVIAEDIELRTNAGGGVDALDVGLALSECPADLYKACDLHFAFVGVGKEIRRELEAAGFYNLVLNKPGLGDVTIFTMQFEKIVHGHKLWAHMLKYIKSQPDINVDAKFEVTRNLHRFGDYPLPPLILRQNEPVFDRVRHLQTS